MMTKTEIESSWERDILEAWNRFKGWFVEGGSRPDPEWPAAESIVAFWAGNPHLNANLMAARLPLAEVASGDEATKTVFDRWQLPKRRGPLKPSGIVEEIFLDSLEVMGPPHQEAHVLLAEYLPEELRRSTTISIEQPHPRLTPPPILRRLFDEAASAKGFTLRGYLRKKLNEARRRRSA